MLQTRVMKFSIYRYDPGKDQQPYMQDFELDLASINGTMLLSALEALKEKDPSLTFRRSCREGVCGSDGMNINGKNGLACITKLVELPDKVVVQPLPGFPVIRDLVVDMKDFFKQYETVKPYLQNKDALPETERIQSPEDRSKLDGLYECILCACCSASCPSYWWNPDKFLGPATLLASYRFVTDSRDTEKVERLSELQDPYKVFRCRSISNCSYVCPKGLNPTRAIGKLKHEMIAGKDT
jgi:succinate dehydrogenase / fumarate reductase, iron-sulfur subunit